ncbi:ATPase [Xanthobacter oligotrophicus]|uniref:P-type ATPase n=1 Tax=Xanthobacter oligotrophicus TaxID=2607286 RepID=UPI0011F1EFEB|nr:ATPase [Xanthobacter oligotrophicus]MCG5237221.1 ATPase [Xanthobacter oligotrophicus]
MLDVTSVELRRAEHFGRIRYASTDRAPEIWRQLSRVLRAGTGVQARSGGEGRAQPLVDLHLDWPEAQHVTIHRVGEAFTNWQARLTEAGRVRLFHPALLRRRDVAFRLRERLSTVVGCDKVGVNTFLGELSVRFRPEVIALEQVVRELERAWDYVLHGADAPLQRGRLLAASSLLGVAYAGQFLVPALRPVAMLGVALYGLPNVIATLRELRELKVGLPALYATGLVLTLLRGLPFHTSVMALLLQIWPRLAFLAFTRSQRRLFGPIRRRVLAVRVIGDDGKPALRDISAVQPGDLIIVGEGEIVPVDGTVAEGHATVDETVLTGRPSLADAVQGTRVLAATEILSGEIRIRAERVGAGTVSATIAAGLPTTHFSGLPSAASAEHIATRNARPALALGFASLLLTRQIRPAQVLLRPDFATEPRLAAQLGALHDVAAGLLSGIFFRTPAAIDRLAVADVLIFDDSVGIDRRRLEVADVVCAGSLAPDALLALAAAGFGAEAGEAGEALQRACAERDVAPNPAEKLSRTAGLARFRAADGAWVDVATAERAVDAGWRLPASLLAPKPASPRTGRRRTEQAGDAEHRLVVRRAGVVAGAVTLLPRGDLLATTVIAALRTRRPDARIVYLSSRAQAQAETAANRVGISMVHGGLRDEEKAAVVATYGARTVFVGDGASRRCAAAMAEAMVSVSVGGLGSVPTDVADVVLLHGGLPQLPALWQIGAGHRARIDTDYRAIYAANLSAVAGALVAGLGSFEVGLASNAITAVLLGRHWARLAALQVAAGVPGSPVAGGEPAFGPEGFDVPDLPGFDLPGFDLPEAPDSPEAFDAADGDGGGE